MSFRKRLDALRGGAFGASLRPCWPRGAGIREPGNLDQAQPGPGRNGPWKGRGQHLDGGALAPKKARGASHLQACQLAARITMPAQNPDKGFAALAEFGAIGARSGPRLAGHKLFGALADRFAVGHG